ncbi:putative serine protease K12H4.7 [Diadema antillarum]|uniref:putative serine protease K12H4.7 n=1 Tax=Diadema antillarum TaxID=105358 RepID=UPI003A86AAA4
MKGAFVIFMVAVVLPFVLGLPRFLNGRATNRNGMLLSPANIENHKLPPDQWFTQQLDHFNDANVRTWKQRFFINDTFYQPGGPVFLMIGGEGTANPIWMVEGAWIEYAREMNAFCLMLEHRYYGKSHPTEDISAQNLQFLSSEQALADLAHFRTVIGREMGLENNPWISFGGSYPGSLSAWFRLKYPHLVTGAVASSAPVEAQLDFPEYLEVVRDSLATSQVGSQCNDAISVATKDIERLMLHMTGWQALSKVFNLCSPLKGSDMLDVANFYQTVAGNFMGIVQYNKDNRAFEGSSPNITIDTLCNIMTNSSVGSELERYAAVNELVNKGECIDVSYSKMVSQMKNTSWNSEAANGLRQWTYQTCTEFGFYQTSDSANQPFGSHFPLSFSIKLCEDVYGVKFGKEENQAGVNSTNTNYGGREIQATKIVFPNGSIDPWHALGITGSTEMYTAIYINGTAHCANMYPSSPDDPIQLTNARLQIRDLVQKWISTNKD